jgi:general nucleoside transport system permease protein
MRLVARPDPAPWHFGVSALGALAATAAFSALLLSFAHADLRRAYVLIFEDSLGSAFALSETLTRATPLILCGLSVAVSFRAKLYNIGAEGQLYAGALAAVAVGGLHGGTGWNLPLGVLFVAMFAAAALAGAALLLGPALLKVRLGVDEVVTTLLLNFVVLLGVSMLLDGPLKDPLSMGWPQSIALNPALELHRLSPRLRVTSGLGLALVLAGLVQVINRHTVFGFEMRAVGANREAARFAGLPVNRVVIQTALLSGALAGLAGAVEVAGRASYVTLDMSPGYGFTGIVIAVLGGLHPAGVVLASAFLAAVQIGTAGMGRSMGVPTFLSDAVLATALLAMLTANLFARYRVRWT